MIVYLVFDDELLGSFLIRIRTPWSEKERVKNVDSIKHIQVNYALILTLLQYYFTRHARKTYCKRLIWILLMIIKSVGLLLGEYTWKISDTIEHIRFTKDLISE